MSSEEEDQSDEVVEPQVGKSPETISPIVWNPPASQPGSGLNVNVNLGLTASYESQLPPAHEVERLEAILPGTLDRLLNLQERALEMGSQEQGHRHLIELDDSKRKSRGQLIAAAVFVVGLAATVLLALNHDEGVAKVVGGGTLLGAVVVFATGKVLTKDPPSPQDPSR